jgi:hypothetical protein
MAIDPSIVLNVKPQQDYAQSLAQMYAIKNAGTQQQLQQQALQQGQYSLQQAGQQQADDQANRAAIQGNTQVDPTTGMPTLNRAGYLGTLAQTAPGRYLPTAQALTAQDIANAKATADYKKTQLENAKAHTDYVGSLLQGVHDQATYTSALNAAMSAGIVKPGELPQVYDPQLVQRQLAQTMSQKDVIAQQQKALEDAEKARHNQATEKNLQATSPQQGRATQLYADQSAGKPLSPDDAAWLKGYEKNVKVTKTDPGMARTSVLLQMPTQITDPNDPSKTIYTTRQGAIGQEAPGSGDAAAARHMDTYMTSGKGGQQLNAFNTAQQHLQILGQAAEALHNGNSTMLNSVANSFAKQTGSPAPTNFDAVKNAVQGEIAKALTGTATVSEQAELQKDMNSASSPAQISGIVQKYTQLMQGKKDALHQQYTDAKKGQPSFDMPTTAPSGMVTVQIPGSPPGHIPASAVTKFKADHPNAQVNQ